jgi:hypothetical protein
MAKYTFVVLTNAVEGKDDAFDEWYTNTHLGDVLAVPSLIPSFSLGHERIGWP